jgi:hypothetical protein
MNKKAGPKPAGMKNVLIQTEAGIPDLFKDT